MMTWSSMLSLAAVDLPAGGVVSSLAVDVANHEATLDDHREIISSPPRAVCVTPQARVAAMERAHVCIGMVLTPLRRRISAMTLRTMALQTALRNVHFPRLATLDADQSGMRQDLHELRARLVDAKRRICACEVAHWNPRLTGLQDTVRGSFVWRQCGRHSICGSCCDVSRSQYQFVLGAPFMATPAATLAC